ncbi:MAG: ATP-binding protein [Kiloniellales bacterium]
MTGLLWDVTDDPRGALRWSLSRLRPLVNEAARERLIADREEVSFHDPEAEVDLLALRRELPQPLERATTAALRAAAERFRGEFLEGLDLPDLHDFQSWCVAEREQARVLHVNVLRALADRPEAALTALRALVRIEPFDVAARIRLLNLLAGEGLWMEAEQKYDSGRRILDGLGPTQAMPLHQAWRELHKGRAGPSTPAAARVPSSVPIAAAVEQRADISEEGSLTPRKFEQSLVGRKRELKIFEEALDRVAKSREAQVILVTGEVGLGKSRFLAEMAAEVQRRGATLLEACGFEAEASRPYGLWVDALRALPRHVFGEVLAGELGPLLQGDNTGRTGEETRDRLFGAVSELVAVRAHSAPPVVVILDDAQWCDDASASLLQYVVRMNRHRPLLILLSARKGELNDNGSTMRVIRGLRHDNLLQELALPPLNRQETARLVKQVAPESDAARVFEESAGNPLFALEVARALPYRGDEVLSHSLTELVRDRIDRLPPSAVEAIRWASVFGQTFTSRLLQVLVSRDPDELVSALEVLERNDLVHEVATSNSEVGTYTFAHDLVRRAVYGALSAPRRRLMHWRVAEALMNQNGNDDERAVELAHHAALAGEGAVAARACVTAGQRCLRLFANAEAAALARRGLYYAESLAEPERATLLIELLNIRHAALRPRREEIEEAARQLAALAERALDHGCFGHARLGFQVLSHLRWERGEWSDAWRFSRQAEMVTRGSDETERLVAMAETGRCLAMLERDFAQAESLLQEAEALSKRLGLESVAAPHGLGMLRSREGKIEEARALFQRAHALACQRGNRIDEFLSLESLVTLEIDCGSLEEANLLAQQLMALAEKLPEGSEAPFARALAALTRSGAYAKEYPELIKAIEDLRGVDAKQRLSYLLTRAALFALNRGDLGTARKRAVEGLETAKVMERPTEIALARTILLRLALDAGDVADAARQRSALKRLDIASIPAAAHRILQGLKVGEMVEA